MAVGGRENSGGFNLAHEIDTPAFVTDEKTLQSDLAQLRGIADEASCKLLYSPKACSLSTVLGNVARHVDGFACSSPFELRLVDRLRDGGQSLHLVSPLIKRETLDAFGARLDYITFNSLSQWRLLRDRVSSRSRVGLRVNPQLSFIRDPRYDPCRPNSKLGVPVAGLAELIETDPASLRGVTGLHFHNNCEATDFASLLATARHIRDIIPRVLHQIGWINLGGGYLFNLAEHHADFQEAVAIFRDGFGLEVFIEPGAAAVRRSGTIEATVHDIFDGDDSRIAILDTTVNHMSEVFEFQFEPDVLGHVEGGLHSYILAGCTCLAGDVFGEYSFDAPLTVGSRIVFPNMGAYTMSKAHRFNGVGLPTIYARRLDGALVEIRADGFDEFARNTGVADIATA
jgi:carboxynorspermidine decarboxylase